MADRALKITSNVSFASIRSSICRINIGDLAASGLLAVLLILPALGLWGALTTYFAGNAVSNSNELNDAFQQARYSVGAEESLERKYRLEPSAEVRQRHRAAADSLIMWLERARAISQGAEGPLVDDVLAKHAIYLGAIQRMFAAIDAGDTAKTNEIDENEADPSFDAIETLVDHTAELRREQAARHLRSLTSVQMEVLIVTPVVLITGLALMALFWRIIQNYRRQAAASLAEAYTTLQTRTAEREEAYDTLRQQMIERTRLEAQLVQSQKLEAVGLLTGGIAHDFNNILGALVLSLESARDQMAGNMAGQAILDEGIATAMLGSDLTRRLLAFAREKPLAPVAFDLNESVCNIGSMLRRTLGGNIVMNLALRPGLWPAQADPSQFSDAVLNLCINARDAMPQGGDMSIETDNVTLDAACAADIPGATPGDYVVLAVIDTGIGMSEEVLARACEPFYTTKERGKGSGMGLSMIYGFVRQSQGYMKIGSVIGQGTTVRLYLPRATTIVAAREATALPSIKAITGGETILVVDDFSALRQATCRSLAAKGYHVLEADGATQALAILDSGAAIDLLFTDIVMPGGLTGPALAKEMRKRGRILPVLFASGYAGDALDIEDATAADVMAKPYGVQPLVARIREMLDAA